MLYIITDVPVTTQLCLLSYFLSVLSCCPTEVWSEECNIMFMLVSYSLECIDDINNLHDYYLIIIHH